jgi:hypothetical protein
MTKLNANSFSEFIVAKSKIISFLVNANMVIIITPHAWIICQRRSITLRIECLNYNASNNVIIIPNDWKYIICFIVVICITI